MIPVMINPSKVCIAVVGQGPAAARRVAQAREGGASDLQVFSPAPCAEIRAAAGVALITRMPEVAELTRCQLVYAAGLEALAAETLSAAARQAGALVNVEDVKHLCDFHVPGSVRRGDLLITVSTNGKSPGLARRLRAYIDGRMGPEWAGYLERLAAARETWKAEGADIPTLTRRTDEMIDENGWLP